MSTERRALEGILAAYQEFLDTEQLAALAEAVREAQAVLDQQNTTIDDLDFTPRPRNVLIREDVTTLWDLTQLTREQLLGFRSFNERALAEVEDKLRELGLALRV